MKMRVFLGLASPLVGLALAAAPQSPVQTHELNRQLLEASQSGNVEEVRSLLTDGADVNAQDVYGCSPLIWAVRNGRAETAQLLLSQGADPEITDLSGISPLSWAVLDSREALVRMLVEAGADINAGGGRMNASPVFHAVQERNLPLLRLLVQLGAHLEVRDLLGRTPLSRAVEAGDMSTLEALVELGANLNGRNLTEETPLTWAVKHSNLAMVDKLIALGADVNRSGFGITPLMAAVEAEDVEKIKSLLAAGANKLLTVPVYGTAVDLARRSGNSEIVDLLGALEEETQSCQFMTTSGPEKPTQPRLMLQTGHADRVTAVDFSKNGELMVSGGWDNAAYLWEVETGKLIRIFKGHEEWIEDMSFSPKGGSFATAGRDGTARIWDTETGAELVRITPRTDNIGLPDLMAAAFSPRGDLLATGGFDGTVRIWDVSGCSEVHAFPLEEAVYSIEFSPDGETMVVGTGGGSAHLIDVKRRVQLSTLKGHRGRVEAVAFSHNGMFVATAASDEFEEPSPLWGDLVAAVWSVATGEALVRKPVSDDLARLHSIAISKDDRQILAADDLSFFVWDSGNGAEITRGMIEVGISVAAFPPDPQCVALGVGNGMIATVNAHEDAICQLFTGDAFSPSSNALATDGRRVLTVGADAVVWSLATGAESARFGLDDQAVSAAAMGSERYVATGFDDGKVILWDSGDGGQVRRLQLDNCPVTHLAVSSDESRFLAATGGRLTFVDGCEDPRVYQWSLNSDGPRRVQGEFIWGISGLGFLMGSEKFFTADEKSLQVRDAAGGQLLSSVEVGIISAAAMSPDGQMAIVGDSAQPGGAAVVFRIPEDFVGDLTDLEQEGSTAAYTDHAKEVTAAALSSDKDLAATGAGDGWAIVRKTATGDEVLRAYHPTPVRAVAFSPDQQILFVGTGGGQTTLWEVQTGRPILTAFSFADGIWVVNTPDGRFDTNNLAEIGGIHWVMPDDPLHALPVEIFARDYYEPRLLYRVLAGESLKPVRSLVELNRVQPKVEMGEIRLDSEDTVSVTVRVGRAAGAFGGKRRTTDPYDLRLFRGGQLVGYFPPLPDGDNLKGSIFSSQDLEKWRRSASVPEWCGKVSHCRWDERSGNAEITFSNIRIPRLTGLETLDLTAYAFNEDRVKSVTVRQEFPAPEGLQPVKGKAYVVTMGVNAYQDESWDLTYAANDARRMQEDLTQRLKRSGLFEEQDVVGLSLISDYRRDELGNRTVISDLATKGNLRAVLEVLSGKRAGRDLENIIPGAERLRRARPEDRILITFSGHGDTQDGEFYLLPYDIGAGDDRDRKQVDTHLLDRSISTAELSHWMRDVDGGEIVLIVDACYSSASVGPEFKPGPLGNRGLGQLAYDKGMRILAATQAQDVALESKRLRHGLLTYSLLVDGLEKGEADSNRDGRIELSEWLQFATEGVPRLYEEAGKSRSRVYQIPKKTQGFMNSTQPYAQKPSLFDYSKFPIPTALGAASQK